MLTLLWREKIVGFLLDNPTTEIKVRELARKLNISPAYVSKTLKILRGEKILKNNKVDLNSPIVRALKIFLNMKKIAEKGVTDMISSLNIIGAGVYGSWANGTNYEDSDLDIWVKVKKHPRETKIASLVGEIRKSVGANVQVLVLTSEDIKRLKNEDPTFYYSLVFGSIQLCGETIE
jgi:predicted nucleotidyltransferase